MKPLGIAIWETVQGTFLLIGLFMLFALCLFGGGWLTVQLLQFWALIFG